MQGRFEGVVRMSIAVRKPRNVLCKFVGNRVAAAPRLVLGLLVALPIPTRASTGDRHTLGRILGRESRSPNPTLGMSLAITIRFDESTLVVPVQLQRD